MKPGYITGNMGPVSDFLVSMLRSGCYTCINQMKSIQLFISSSVIYIWGRRWILVLLLIFVDWYKHSNTNFKSILVYNLKTKSDFWSKCPHYIMNYISNLGSTFFLLLLVLNLAYIDYSLCQILSVYMQYFRCCDQSNKCLHGSITIRWQSVVQKWWKMKLTIENWKWIPPNN